MLLIADHRAYYLDREAFYGTPGRNPLIPYYRFRNWQDLERVVRAFGITHVMMNSSISENYWDPAVGRKRDKEYRGWVETLIERDLEPIFCRGSLCLYRFKSPEEPGAAGDQ